MAFNVNRATICPLLAAGVLAAGVAGAGAQSADALIDKLVEKGILSVREAKELREEADKGFNTAFAAKTGMPEWVTGFRMGGDFRARFEGFYAGNPTAAERNRFQYRLRYGMTVDMFDRVEAGFRLASIGDTAGNPISSNQTFDNNASKKGLSLDLVYGRWRAIETADWSVVLTAGKMENPFVFTPIVFDPDYTPEGIAQQLTYRLNPHHDLKLNVGGFVLEESGTTRRDSYLVGAQARWEARWGEKWTTALGGAALAITDKGSLTPANGQLNIGEGNSRTGGLAAGDPVHNFTPVILSAEAGYTLDRFPMYPGAFPLRLTGEYLRNTSAPTANEGYSVKLTLGKSGKRKTWDLSYELRLLERDAIYEELPESDFNAFTQVPLTVGGVGGFVNGTNVRGHILRLGYSPFDSITLSVTYWITENIVESPAGASSAARRLQADIVWKF